VDLEERITKLGIEPSNIVPTNSRDDDGITLTKEQSVMLKVRVSG